MRGDRLRFERKRKATDAPISSRFVGASFITHQSDGLRILRRKLLVVDRIKKPVELSAEPHSKLTFGLAGIPLRLLGLRRLIRAYFILISQVSPQACFTVISVGTAFDISGIVKIDAASKQIDAGIASRIQSSFLMVIRWRVPICHGID